MLIIDEISMISAELFDGIEATVCKIRKRGEGNVRSKGEEGGDVVEEEDDDRAFGGIQIIACGVSGPYPFHAAHVYNSHVV